MGPLARQAPVEIHELSLLLVEVVDEVRHVVQPLFQERVGAQAQPFVVTAAPTELGLPAAAQHSTARTARHAPETLVLAQLVEEGVDQVRVVDLDRNLFQDAHGHEISPCVPVDPCQTVPREYTS